MTKIPMAVQLYTVRDEMDLDLAATLRKVAEIGYRRVELAGVHRQTSKEIKSLLDDFGLMATSAHVSIDALAGDDLGKVIKEYSVLDIRTLVVPWISPELRDNGHGYASLAETLNRIGGNLKSEGFKLGYHNHNFEFEDSASGKIGMQWLMDGTSPDLVSFELDTYWVLFAGLDPVKFIDEHAARFNMLHIKDMDPADRSFAPVGTGILPLDGILAAAHRAPGVEYLIVEQDTFTRETPIESIEISFKTMSEKGYA